MRSLRMDPEAPSKGSAHALCKSAPGSTRQPVKSAHRRVDGQSSLPVPALKSKNGNDGGWKEPTVRFPVTCPICARALLTELPVALIAEALIVGSSIRLHASCHDVYWDAQTVEIEQLREYLAIVGVSGQRGAARRSTSVRVIPLRDIPSGGRLPRDETAAG